MPAERTPRSRACKVFAAPNAASWLPICAKDASWKSNPLNWKNRTKLRSRYDDTDCRVAAGNPEEERRTGGGTARPLHFGRRSGAEPGFEPRHRQDRVS